MTLIADLAAPSSPNGREVLVPASRAAWRQFLETNPGRSEGVWVVYRRERSGVEGPEYMDLVEEALCYRWIDSMVKRLDDDRLIQ